MVTDRECEDYARECVRLAYLTQDEQIREKLLQMARDWTAMATRKSKTLSRLPNSLEQSKAILAR